jgi:hypothetical protein
VSAEPGSGSVEEPMEPVRITPSKASYAAGQVVSFELANRSAGPIYFRSGCSLPVVERLEAGTSIPLTLTVLESVPDVRTLGPAETRVCSWDQRAWQAPGLEGRARFQSFEVLAPVPPGEYRLRLDYAVALEELEALQPVRSVHSRSFRID